MQRRRRILFFAEAVTLAHVARPIVLARSLDPTRFEAVIACHPRCDRFLAPERIRTEALASIDSGEFAKRLASGSPVFTADELQRYVREDLALIERIKPDLIVGDFRLSLSVSARLAKIPYATVTNAYWSPHAQEQGMPLPVLPMTRLLPVSILRGVFDMVRPIAMRAHCAALNRVRVANGLPTLGHDIRRVYTDADHVLYADVPSLFPMNRLPANHHFIGALDWSPPVDRPAWWGELPTNVPTIYLTLGSSGSSRVLDLAADALASLPVAMIVATAGARITKPMASNVFMSDYVDGSAAARRSQLVVGNGGSMGCQQAIAAGVPMVGIASNMDQFLNMAAIEAAGAGRMMRADRVTPSSVRAAVTSALGNAGMRRASEQLREAAAGPTMTFGELASSVLGRTTIAAMA